MPFPKFGFVYHDPNFPYQDGEAGNKLFVVLSLDVADNLIVARTTSRSDRKSWTYGCHNNDPYPNFFIPKDIGIFPDNTWVSLNYLTEFDQLQFDNKVAVGLIEKKNELPKRLMRELLECAAAAEGTTVAQERAIRDILAKL